MKILVTGSTGKVGSEWSNSFANAAPTFARWYANRTRQPRSYQDFARETALEWQINRKAA
jgi:hypothetical protein